jgi:hypothetical protein
LCQLCLNIGNNVVREFAEGLRPWRFNWCMQLEASADDVALRTKRSSPRILDAIGGA